MLISPEERLNTCFILRPHYGKELTISGYAHSLKISEIG